jgi:hypothetical protein
MKGGPAEASYELWAGRASRRSGMCVLRRSAGHRGPRPLEGIPRSPYELIHIATHGYVDRSNGSDRFAGLWFRDGHVTVSDLDGLGNALRGQSVVSTACFSGDRAIAKALITKGACCYVVAPQGAPYFHNAIFFAHLFYHHYFIHKRSVGEILARYDKRYRNPHQFAGVPLSKYGLSFVP